MPPLDLTALAVIGVTALNYGVVAVLIGYLVVKRRDTKATLAWIFALLLVPFLSVPAFWILGFNRLRTRRWRRRRGVSGISRRLRPLADGPGQPQEAGPDDIMGLFDLARRLGGMSPEGGNAVELYRRGEAAFDALETAVDQAQHHLHVLYYAWIADRTGTRMRDALVRAAKRGVEVRLLVDDVGSLGTPAAFFQELVEAGGRSERFFQLGLIGRRLSLNNRNHRKLLVADGTVGFTGGMNVGDDYAGLGQPWQDAHVRVEGPAIHRLQEIFCEDWYHTTGEDLAKPEYFESCPPAGSEWVQFIGSGPGEQHWRSIHMILFSAITQARERAWLETPYFVPDSALLLALESAALRGVDVRLLLPGKSDHPVVLYAGRFYYTTLLAAGVRIFEIPQAFLHAKTATIDGRFATVGSANLDQRSFRLNFEANAFFYGPTVAGALERSFEETQAKAVELTSEQIASRGRVRRVVEGLARLFGPVL